MLIMMMCLYNFFEDREFKNQFREFLQKNTRIEEEKKEKQKKKTRVKKSTSKLFH